MDGWNTSFLLGPSLLSGCENVSLREGISSKAPGEIFNWHQFQKIRSRHHSQGTYPVKQAHNAATPTTAKRVRLASSGKGAWEMSNMLER